MRRGWCEHYGCVTHGSLVVWVDLGVLGTIPVWCCRSCAAPYLQNPAHVQGLLA